MRRVQLATFAVAVLLFSAWILPAQATPAGDDGEHKVWVCHATDSDTNPYELIHIDEAGWLRGHHAQHLDDFDAPGDSPTESDCYDSTTTTSGGGI